MADTVTKARQTAAPVPHEERSDAAGGCNLHSSELYGMPGHLIRRCHQISVGLFHDELADFNLTPVQFAVLRRLQEVGSVDQVTLAGYAAVNHVTMGEVARRLEARGLLERQVNPNDRRARLLRLTDEGRSLTQRMMPAVRRVQERLLAPLDADEQALMIRLLQRVADENNELSRAPLKTAQAGRAGHDRRQR